MLWELPNFCTVSNYRLQALSPLNLFRLRDLSLCKRALRNWQTHTDNIFFFSTLKSKYAKSNINFFSAEILRDPHSIMQWIKAEDSPVPFLPYPHLACNLQPWSGILFSKTPSHFWSLRSETIAETNLHLMVHLHLNRGTESELYMPCPLQNQWQKLTWHPLGTAS